MEKAGIHLEPEKYQFKAGDVCVTTYGVLRIIVFNPEANELQSYNTKGSYENHTAEYFQKNNYRKIGELKDFIK